MARKPPEGWVDIVCEHGPKPVVLAVAQPAATVYSPTCREGRFMRPHPGPDVKGLRPAMLP